MLLLSAAVIEVLTKLDAEEGGMEIEEYISLEEELVPKACVINWIKVRKVIKALGVI